MPRTYAIYKGSFEYDPVEYVLTHFDGSKVKHKRYSEKGLYNFMRNNQKSVFLYAPLSPLEDLVAKAKLPLKETK